MGKGLALHFTAVPNQRYSPLPALGNTMPAAWSDAFFERRQPVEQARAVAGWVASSGRRDRAGRSHVTDYDAPRAGAFLQCRERIGTRLSFDRETLDCPDGAAARAVTATTVVWIISMAAFWIGYHCSPQLPSYRTASRRAEHLGSSMSGQNSELNSAQPLGRLLHSLIPGR